MSRLLYKVSFGSGLAWLEDHFVEAEEWHTEQDSLGVLIDQLEQEGSSGMLLSCDEITSGLYPEDKYSIGGNHGRALLHHGNLLIEKITEEVLV